VKDVLAGRTPVELPPFDFAGGTDFQRRVWEELTWTPCGETRSYAEIAKAIRKPKAVRAVGAACGANPIPLLIPCHRVLAANQKIGGFSGGLKWKKKLLGVEGVVVS
jgi:O-6-methylguanine DNA methyltransferase